MRWCGPITPSRTVTPRVLPEQKSDMTAELAMHSPGTLKVSNMSCATFSRFSFDVSGDSVINTCHVPGRPRGQSLGQAWRGAISRTHRHARLFWLQPELIKGLLHQLLEGIEVDDVPTHHGRDGIQLVRLLHSSSAEEDDRWVRMQQFTDTAVGSRTSPPRYDVLS